MEPFIVPAVGVTVPLSLCVLWCPGREDVDAKMEDREALLRRYGNEETDERGERLGLRCGAGGAVEVDSASDSCGDCRGSSGFVVIREDCDAESRLSREESFEHLLRELQSRQE